MPSLADSLDQLRSLSGQINQLSSCNCRPSGPYTSAYLGTSVVPDLIRDASEAEKRLFKFVGESDSSIKRVEKREGLVTPLRDLKAGRTRAGQSEIDAVLNAVAALVDDYRPMPRARKHISSLAERHESQTRRIAELEDLIAQQREGTSSKNRTQAAEQLSPTPVVRQPKPKRELSPDEAIKAEEESLKALEALIRPHREAAIAAEYTSPEKPSSSPIKQSIAPPQSPPSRTARPSIFNNAQTPARTPAKEYPHISNSLVTGATPFQSGKINRFTPLKNLGTPRTRERGSIFGAGPPRSVSGNRRSTVVPPPPTLSTSKASREEDEEEDAMGDNEDDTVRITDNATPMRQDDPPSPTPDRAMLVHENPADVTPRASPVKPNEPSPVKGPKVVDGVEIERVEVQEAISRIQATSPDLMRHATSQDEVSSPESVVDLLYRLSVAEPEEMPRSSDSTASSTLSEIPAPPITKASILQAHLYLLLLRSPDLSMPGNEAKQHITAVIEARQWDEWKAATVVFEMAGRKALLIDRKSGGGPSGILRLK